MTVLCPRASVLAAKPKVIACYEGERAAGVGETMEHTPVVVCELWLIA